jgi:hypothetical protein
LTPCKLCVHPDQAAISEAFAAGLPDRAIGARFGVSHMSAYRHRVQHVVKPAKDQLALLEKDRTARERRKELAAAAASDTPSTQAIVEAALGIRAQVGKLAAIEARLSRVAAKAEADDAPQHVAQLASQQLRSVEVGARLGQVGGYAAPRNVGPGGGDGTRFSITINLAPDRQINIAAIATPQDLGANEIDGEVPDTDSGDPI